MLHNATISEEELNLLANVITGDTLDKMTFPPTRWAIPGLLPEGFGLLTGAPKIGKSWAVLGIALAVAEGGLALGSIYTGDPRPVLYLALEDGPSRIQSRARKLLGTATPIPPMLSIITEVEVRANVLPTIETWLKLMNHEAPLVVLDTLGKVMPNAMPGEGAYDRDYRIGGDLKRIAARHPGASIVVVHHVNKRASEDWMDSTSGTNGLNGAADFTVMLSRKRNDSAGLLQVTGRDVPEAEYAMTIADGAWSLDGKSLKEARERASQVEAQVNVGGRAFDVLSAMQDYPDGITPSALGKRLDISGDDTGKYLRRLADQGRVKKIGRGTYVLSDVSELSESSSAQGSVLTFPSARSDTSDTSDNVTKEDS